MITTGQHWLVRVARQANLNRADTLNIPFNTATAEAWRMASAGTGVTPWDLAQAVATVFRTRVADLSTAQPTAVKLLPASLARKHQVLPLADRERVLVVAGSDPTDPDAESAVGFASGRMPQLEIAPPAELERAIEAAYSIDNAVESLLQLVGEGNVQLVADSEQEKVNLEDVGSPPVVRLANAIIFEAVRQGASDIHLQPTATAGVVRNRVDGVLRTGMQIPLPVLARVISRIKVLARLDIADHVRPQDGRMRISVNDRVYDLRVSTVPTRDAEKCVIRILDPKTSKRLEEVGIPARELEILRRQLKRRDGIIVVTGPTGSGKTTTLYAALQEVATEDLNAMTVEDPIEYELPGLTQIPVEPKRGVTFASALRAILRQDPDVIFVGEIRDQETAGIAVQASLTGHLVLTTLHTNDALGAIRRLSDLGVEIPAITQTLRASMAQRLMRQVCSNCAERVTDELTPDEARLAEDYGVRPVVRAKGCERCTDSGYRGRLPIVELLVMTPELERLILARAPSAELLNAAVKGGMRTLKQAALDRVRSGETTLQEAERVIGERADGEPTESSDASTARQNGDGGDGGEAAPGVPSVLVADDDSSNRLIARALLERAGYRVTEAVDGAAAWDRLSDQTSYNLMILDLDMPRMTGREVLKQVRGTPTTAGLPVIVLTGASDEATEIELLEKGADDYLRKPLDPARFLSRVKAALRRAQG